MKQIKSFGQILYTSKFVNLIPQVDDKNWEMSREKQTRFMQNTYSLYIPYAEDNIRIWEEETNRWLEKETAYSGNSCFVGYS